MTFLNTANIWDMLKCPNNAIFREFKIPLSNYTPFFLFLNEVVGSSAWGFFAHIFHAKFPSCTLNKKRHTVWLDMTLIKS